jgi:hypothetical protein
MFSLSTLGHIQRCVVFSVGSYSMLDIFEVESCCVESFEVQSFDDK